MIPVATLRDWAGVADSSQDATLQSILAGVAELFGRTTRRIIVSPPAVYEQVLDVPVPYNGGLSGVDADEVHSLLLAEEPRRKRSGTVTVGTASTAVTGTDTAFLSELSADPGSLLRIGSESHLIDTIASDTALVLATAHAAGATDSTYEAELVSIESRSTIGGEWAAEDLTDFEVEGRSLITTRSLPTGRRRLRVRYLLGYAEGELPAGWELVLKKGLRATWTERSRRTSSISVDGAIKVDWASMGSQGESLRAGALTFARPLGRQQPGRFLTGSYLQWAA